MLIFVHSRGQKLDPMPLEEINRQLQAAQIFPDDLAWHEGLPTWIPLRSMQGVIVPQEISRLSGLAVPSSSPMPPAIPSSPSVTPASAGTDPLAICSLVFGIVGLLCCSAFIPSLAAVVCGHISLSKYKRNPLLEGRPLALTGLILGYVGMVIGVVYLVFVFGMTAVSAFQESVK